MITQARLEETVKPAGLDWITALRAPAIQAGSKRYEDDVGGRDRLVKALKTSVPTLRLAESAAERVEKQRWLQLPLRPPSGSRPA